MGSVWSCCSNFATFPHSSQQPVQPQELLREPNPASPANKHASTLFVQDKRQYAKLVRECVENSWMFDPEAVAVAAKE